MIKNHVPSLETCKKLKNAEFPQRTIYEWVEDLGGEWRIVLREHSFGYWSWCAAPILSEILEAFEIKVNLRKRKNEWLCSGQSKGNHTHHVNAVEAAANLWLKIQKERSEIIIVGEVTKAILDAL